MTEPASAQDHPSSLQPSTPKRAGRENAPLISRRDFGRNAALVATMSLSPSKLLGELPGFEHLATADLGKRFLDNNSPASAHAQEVAAKLANIIRKYGDRLSDSQREHLRRILTYNEEMLASIHAFPLQNGDAPATVLKVTSLQSIEYSPTGAVNRNEVPFGQLAPNESEV